MKFNILVLGSKNYSNKQIVKHIEKAGHTAFIISPNDIIINFGRNGESSLFVNDEQAAGIDFHAVIPRIGRNFAYGCAVLEYLTETVGVYSTATAEGLRIASDKFRSAIFLAKAGVASPRTTSVRVPDNFSFLVDSVGGLPCIAKNVKGSQGAGVNIFVDKLQSSIALKNMRTEKKSLLLQEFIETAESDQRKSDLRVHVVGSKVVCAYRRMSLDDDFRSNYSLSKQGEKVNLNAAQTTLSIKAAEAVGLTYAGVDIAVDAKTKKSYVLEINGNPSLKGVTKITGYEVGGDLAEETISELEKEFINEIETEVVENVVKQLGQKKSFTSFKTVSFLEHHICIAGAEHLGKLSLLKSCDSLPEFHEKIKVGKGFETWLNEKTKGLTQA